MSCRTGQYYELSYVSYIVTQERQILSTLPDLEEDGDRVTEVRGPLSPPMQSTGSAQGSPSNSSNNWKALRSVLTQELPLVAAFRNLPTNKRPVSRRVYDLVLSAATRRGINSWRQFYRSRYQQLLWGTSSWGGRNYLSSFRKRILRAQEVRGVGIILREDFQHFSYRRRPALPRVVEKAHA
jgi:hypothetical protein